jgi:hypothetical protein
MKKRLVLAALSLPILAAAGCASQQTPPPAAAPAAPTPAPVEVRSALEFGGPQVSIYHPDARTLYLWSGDPRQGPANRKMTCIKIQMGDSPSGGPMTDEPCS